MDAYSAAFQQKLRFSRTAIVLFALLECLVVAQAVFAYRDQMLTVSQMQQRGIQHGLPFLWHFAMWSDLAVVSPLAAYLVQRFHLERSAFKVAASIATGVVTSIVLHWFYTLSNAPEAHVQDHQLTAAGIAHLIYMALTLSIFIRFLLLTDKIPPKLLRIVSAILFLHVFVGTHMLLGIANLAFPLEWYGGQPLRSAAGWTTVAFVGATLLALNFPDIWNWQTLASPDRRFPVLKTVADLFEFWTLNRFDTTERYLKSLDYIASYLGFTAFLTVFVAKVQMSTAFNGGIFYLENWVTFVSETALPCLLLFLFGLIHGFGRQSIRLELSIGPKLFPPGRVPDDWGGPKDRVIAFLSVISFLLLFLMLTWFADNIKIASLIMFVLACNDWRTRYLINSGIGGYFSLEKYAPRPGDKDYDLILERREVADKFLFKKPHLWKEAGRAVGCGLAFAVSLSGYLRNTTSLDFAAYIILIGTLVLNEVITLRWRYRMFSEMRDIDRKAAERRAKEREAQEPLRDGG
jgi:hypothetical protein